MAVTVEVPTKFGVGREELRLAVERLVAKARVFSPDGRFDWSNARVGNVKDF